MMKIPHMNSVGVRYRLGLLVLLSIVALLAVGFGGWLGISKVSQSVVTLQDQRLPFGHVARRYPCLDQSAAPTVL